MKSAGQFIDMIHNVKCAWEHLHSFMRDAPGTNGEKLAKVYIKKLEWIYNDMVTYPHFPRVVIDGIKKEWESDTFANSAIVEKVAMLTPAQKEAIENIIDKVLKGETIITQYDEQDN